jgi:hypothetical protein
MTASDIPPEGTSEARTKATGEAPFDEKGGTKGPPSLALGILSIVIDLAGAAVARGAMRDILSHDWGYETMGDLSCLSFSAFMGALVAVTGILLA